MYFYGFLHRKILEILQFLQYTKIYETMEKSLCVISHYNYETVNPGDFLWG